MKIYIAGKTHDIPTVREVQQLCRINGHAITYDWTEKVEEVGGPANEKGVSREDQKKFAYYDVMGVYTCDLLIACGHPNLAGTFIEVGLALAWGRPIWLFNWHLARYTIFQTLDNFTMFEDWESMAEKLQVLDPRRIERGSNQITFNLQDLDIGG